MAANEGATATAAHKGFSLVRSTAKSKDGPEHALVLCLYSIPRCATMIIAWLSKFNPRMDLGENSGGFAGM
jgi:hypothetical protein